jgi:hypothetical protein
MLQAHQIRRGGEAAAINNALVGINPLLGSDPAPNLWVRVGLSRKACRPLLTIGHCCLVHLLVRFDFA